VSQAGEALKPDPVVFEAICKQAVACDHCFQHKFATQSFVDVAQPRYVGPRYWRESRRRLFLFMNPGEGHASVEDREMRAALHAFHAGSLALDSIFSGQRSYMGQWGRNGKFMDFFNAIKVPLDSIAMLNVAWCAVKGDKPPAPMLGACWSRFTRRTITALAPTQIIACGDSAERFARNAQLSFTKVPHYATRRPIDYSVVRRLIGSDSGEASTPLPVASVVRSRTGATTGRVTVIRLIEKRNPKSGKSRLRYDCYRDGMTVAEYETSVAARLGHAEAAKCRADIEWDLERRFIRLEER